MAIYCPCCRKSSKRWDVWYDCQCFQGGKKACENCLRVPRERDEHIAAEMRRLGWDKNPSPGMRDYLTPGWRGPATRVGDVTAWADPDGEIPF